ncbi:uncharacterized protein LOC111302464 [Durio zibethinus]|uniref:Uncharacterized protein LOC111302464 n=1 Tax=Durio zibethinus TaxID=66656 RepID=A0A6P5ZP18_DURZI|nr:uncharacterized protein LOC111302464 [Durio zibethinus]
MVHKGLIIKVLLLFLLLPGYLKQRSANMVDYHADSRRLDCRAPGLDSTSTFSLRCERLKPVQDEHLNQFYLKQFPRPSHLDTEPVPKFGSHFCSSRPLDRGPHGFGIDTGPWAHEKEPHGLNFDPVIGSGPSRILPPYQPDDGGERPVGVPKDTLGRTNFLGTVPSNGQHHVDGFVPRSQGREYPGKSVHGFGDHPGNEIDGRECRFNDRFSGLPEHLHGGGFESSDHMAKHWRSFDMIGPDIRPLHFRRGEHLVHPNMPGHLQMGKPIGFGDLSSHERMGEFGGPGNFRQSRLGEPGFRSSFSLRKFPNDGGIYTGDMESFENLERENQ